MMRIKGTSILVVVCIVFGGGLMQARGVDVFVSLDGQDTHHGSRERPFATLQAAQTAVRGLIAAGLTEPVDVILRAGTYYLPDGLLLEPQDSGTHVKHVHFKGLEFRHTTFTLGQIEARVHTDAAVMFANTSDCRIEQCHFENVKILPHPIRHYYHST
jgi:hypothetical protein